MHARSLCPLLLITSLFVAISVSAQNNPCNVISQGPQGSLNGFVPFPSSSLWNTNISNAPVDPNSGAIINFIGGSTPLHPDFGSGLYQGHTFGMPYIVVPVNQPLATIQFTAYGSESDPGRCRFLSTPPSRDTLIPAPALTVMCWYSTRETAGFTSSTMHTRMASPSGPRLLPQCGTSRRTNSGPTLGPPPMLPGCLSSPDWFAMMRSPPATSTMPSA